MPKKEYYKNIDGGEQKKKLFSVLKCSISKKYQRNYLGSYITYNIKS